jgi:hypothetical protein
MLQVLHLDVLKVDRVLHLPPRFLLPHIGVSSSWAARPRVGVRNGAGNGYRHGSNAHPSGCPGASNAVG